MRLTGLIAFLILKSYCGYSQNQSTTKSIHRKGKLYFSWGWNREWFSKSDIHFKGPEYDFTIKKVVAKDRPSEFEVDTYFNPNHLSTPQFSFKVGYFFKNNFSIAFGTDHMKYVVEPEQVVKISGNISGTETIYDGTYSDNDITLKDDFLQFEHTNGLNYINVDLRRFDEIFSFHKISVNLTEGLESGILLPRTDATLLNNENYDEFHLAGYGVNVVAGVNISFLKSFFVQTEAKGGYINMPDIRTTPSAADMASQNFFFTQFNFVFGATIDLHKKKKETDK